LNASCGKGRSLSFDLASPQEFARTQGGALMAMMRYVVPKPKLHAWRHMGRTTAQDTCFGLGGKGCTMFPPPFQNHCDPVFCHCPSPGHLRTRRFTPHGLRRVRIVASARLQRPPIGARLSAGCWTGWVSEQWVSSARMAHRHTYPTTCLHTFRPMPYVHFLHPVTWSGLAWPGLA
jgi:hypothetical protein